MKMTLTTHKNTMHLIAAIVSAVILIGTASGALALANNGASPAAAEVPPGQLNRKGISGIVSSVGTGSLDVHPPRNCHCQRRRRDRDQGAGQNAALLLRYLSR